MQGRGSFIIYIGAGILFFLFWLFWVFPYDALQSRIITEIENQTGGRYHLDTEEMDVSLLGKVTFEKLKIKERVGGTENILIETPLLKLGFSPLGLLSSKLDLSFYMEGSKKGEVEGDIKQEGDDFELDLNLDAYPISELKFLAAQMKVGIQGTLDGGIRLRVNQADPGQNEGKIAVNLENFTMDPTKIQLDPSDPASAMDIPRIKITGARGSHIDADLIKNKLEVRSIALNGGDLDLNLKGNITLEPGSPGDFRLALEGGLKFSETLAKALPILGILEQEKNEQGVYPVSLSGRLRKPAVRVGKFRIPI